MEKELQEIGLSVGESKVYISLLKYGECSITQIIKQSSVSTSKVYDILNRLSKKGFISSITYGKGKKYLASNPRVINELLNKEKSQLYHKEELAKNLITNLESIPQKKVSTRIETLSGSRAISYFFNESIEENDNKTEILVAGYSKEASEFFNLYFRQFHKKRIQKNIPGKVIYDYETWNLKQREKRKFVEQRFFNEGFTTPSFIWICSDVVGIISFTSHEKICIKIKSEEISQSYKNYFEILWQGAIKTNM